LSHNLKYRVLAEPLAVCRLASNAGLPARVMEGKFFCIVRAPDELSIVCPEHNSSEDLLSGARVELGWVAFQLEGPFPFSLTGVLASFLQPLAEARIPIFAISTFDTDYVLIKRGSLERAVAALGAAGHERLSGDQG
jgi:uncharacterized protein